MKALLALVGALVTFALWLLGIAVGVAAFVVYINGILFGFAHSVLLGLVSIIPVVGFVEGLLHILGAIH